VAPRAMVYGRFARGFKSASFNIDLVPSTNGLFAGPENATTYELGLKSDLLGRTLRLNLAGFVTRYNDMQVSQLLGSGVTLDNAGKATIKGVEAELVLTPVRPLRLSASTRVTTATPIAAFPPRSAGARRRRARATASSGRPTGPTTPTRNIPCRSAAPT
jgi:iron complex outermembrane receptor protein